MLNLDTHILINSLTGHLSPTEEAMLKRDGEWCISGIVLWEIVKLHQLGRIAYGLEHPTMAAAIDMIQVIPVNLQVCKHLTGRARRGLRQIGICRSTRGLSSHHSGERSPCSKYPSAMHPHSALGQATTGPLPRSLRT